MASGSHQNKLRILVIAPGCNGQDVGEAWSAYQWVSGIAKRHSVTLLTYQRRDRPTVVSQLPGVEVIEWRDLPIVGRWDRFNSMLKPGYVPFYLKARAWVTRAREAGKDFDLVHQITPLSPRYPSPALGLRIPFIIGPLGGSLPTPKGFASEMIEPWFSKLRALDGWRFKHDPFLRRTLEEAAVVVGVAPYVRDLLSEVNLQRFEVMSETGILSLPENRSQPPDREQFRALYVGRIVRSKGVLDAVRALASPGCPGHVVLDVVGDGEGLSVCTEEARKLGIVDRVIFHGRQSRQAVEAFYEDADVFLFPSFREASGNVVLEAMRHGVPVVTSSIGGPAHMIDENSGIRITPDSPDQYAVDLGHALARIAACGDLRQRLGSGAKERVAALALWPKKIEWVCRLYADVLTGH